MEPVSNINKTVFLEEFKTCNKYMKSHYIAQEVFFNNMMKAMALAKQYQPEKITSQPDAFDEVEYRKEVIRIVKSLGPVFWRDYGNLSEQMQAEANRYFFAATTDAASIAVGKGVGRLADKATKAISRKYAKHLVHTVTKKGNVFDVNVNRLANSKTVPTRMTASVHIKTKNKIWRKELFPWEKQIVHPTADIKMTIDPTEVFLGQLADGVTDYAEQTFAPNLVSSDTVSFSFGDSFAAEAGNVVTDFIPYVGNAKAGVAAFYNCLIGIEYTMSAKKIKKMEEQSMEADRKFFNKYLFVDIENDLKAMNKTKLYQMWRFSVNQLNVLMNNFR